MPGIGADKAQAVLHNDRAGAGAQHCAALLQHQLHQAGVFFARLPPTSRPVPEGVHRGQIHQPAFGFGDDLLRQHQDIAILPALDLRPCPALQNELGQVIPGLHQGNVQVRGSGSRLGMYDRQANCPELHINAGTR